jgi:hypothetical protein
LEEAMEGILNEIDNEKLNRYLKSIKGEWY